MNPKEARPTPRQPAASGFSLVELLIVVAIIGIVTAISIPNLIASRRAANEASAISAVRTLSSAQEGFRVTFGSGRFGTLAQLLERQMVDPVLANATAVERSKSGYIFAVNVAPGGMTYCIGAAPVSDFQGSRNYSTDTPGVIYLHPLSVASPPTTTAGGTALR